MDHLTHCLSSNPATGSALCRYALPGPAIHPLNDDPPAIVVRQRLQHGFPGSSRLLMSEFDRTTGIRRQAATK